MGVKIKEREKNTTTELGDNLHHHFILYIAGMSSFDASDAIRRNKLAQLIKIK